MKNGAAIVVALGVALLWKLLDKKKSGVGSMSDPAPTLDNLKRGISNGWYTAELVTVNGQQAVRLSGKLTNGEYYSDIYPITSEVAAELKQMGVPTV